MPPVQLATRLAVYGLDPAKLKMNDITVEANQQLVLNSTDAANKAAFVKLSPKSVTDVKSWMGVPDAAFTHAPVILDHPISVIPTLSTFTPVQKIDLHKLANTFVFGHSNSVAAAQIPALNAWLAAIQAQVNLGFFLDIHVKSGGKLVLASSVHVLFARYITIDHGGQLIVKATHTKIDAAGIKGL